MACVVANGASGCAGLKAQFVESRLASSHWLVPVRAAHFAEQRRAALNSRLRRQNGGAQRRRQQGAVVKAILPADPWSPGIDSQSIASSLFAASLFPYLGFLYHLTKSKTAPPLTLFGFYFLLVFVGATIPAGIYAKLHYGTSLSNVDWLHGGAESLLTLTNLFIVFGLRGALRTPTEEKSTVEVEQDEKLPLSK